MGKWESLVERLIREAMEQGAFSDLPGKGRPINLDENPFEDPELRMAHRLLKQNGFAPAWVEERKDLDASVDGARADLARSWRVYRESAGSGRHAAQAEADWQRVVNGFRRQVADLNRRIAAFNLKAPSASLHRLPLDADREINNLTSAG